MKHPTPTRMGRRTFLATAAAVALGGCSVSRPDRTYNLGNSTRLRMLNWPEYIDVDDLDDPHYAGGTLDRVSTEVGLDVTYSPEYGDTVQFDDILAYLSADGNAGTMPWDMIVVPNSQASQLIERSLAEPIPLELIPNHVNLDPAYMTNSWDRGSRYQMPWQAGVTGLAYNRAAVTEALGAEPTSLATLFDPAFQGRVAFVTEMREGVGLAMLANGDDPSRPTPDTARDGLIRIEEAFAAGQVVRFGDVDIIDMLTSNTVDVAMAWSGDASRLPPDEFGFLVPVEGAVQWFDTMVIPKGSSAVGAAGRFMNFVYDPVNAAAITSWVGYITPVLGTREVLAAGSADDQALAENELIFPSATTRSRLYTWGVLDPTVEAEIEATYGSMVAALSS